MVFKNPEVVLVDIPPVQSLNREVFIAPRVTLTKHNIRMVLRVWKWWVCLRLHTSLVDNSSNSNSHLHLLPEVLIMVMQPSITLDPRVYWQNIRLRRVYLNLLRLEVLPSHVPSRQLMPVLVNTRLG